MSFELTPLHLLGAVFLKRTKDNELIQKIPYQQARLPAALEGQFLPIHRAEAVLLHEVFKTSETVGVPTRRVHGLEQRLKANVTSQVVIYFILEVIKMIVWQQVNLSTFVAKLPSFGDRFSSCRVGHGVKRLLS